MYKDHGHENDVVKEWTEEDKKELKEFLEDIVKFKVRVNYWLFRGDMDMVHSLLDVIVLYDEYVDYLKEKYEANYGTNKNTPNINIFGRN